MDKIIWCVKKKEGLNIIEPNTNLAEAYIRKAEESLQSMQAGITKDWKIATAYYALYFSLYALLMKIGIRCEIHSCTIVFAKHYLAQEFTEEEITFLEDALQARIDSQYYVDRTVPNEQYEQLLQGAPRFLVHCKTTIEKITEKRIVNIREEFKKHH